MDTALPARLTPTQVPPANVGRDGQLSFLTEEKAFEVIPRPVLTIIRDCLRDGMGDWNELCQRSPHITRKMDNRSRACAVYNFICEYLVERLSERDDVRLKKCALYLAISIGTDIVLRVKKLNKKCQISYTPTANARRFFEQLKLMVVNPVTCLIAGYELDVTETAVKDTFLGLPNGRDLVWLRSLDVHLDGDTAKIVEAVAPVSRNVEESAKVIGPRIRAKRSHNPVVEGDTK